MKFVYFLLTLGSLATTAIAASPWTIDQIAIGSVTAIVVAPGKGESGNATKLDIPDNVNAAKWEARQLPTIGSRPIVMFHTVGGHWSPAPFGTKTPVVNNNVLDFLGNFGLVEFYKAGNNSPFDRLKILRETSTGVDVSIDMPAGTFQMHCRFSKGSRGNGGSNAFQHDETSWDDAFLCDPIPQIPQVPIFGPMTYRMKKYYASPEEVLNLYGGCY